MREASSRFGKGEDDASLVREQKQQVVVRIALSLLILAYLFAHAGPAMHEHLQLGIAAIGAYCAFNLLTLPWITRHPFHLPRMFIAPLPDIALTSLGMWLDGGTGSPLYIMFFIIIAGNGLRFGNILLLYSQIISLLGLATVGLVNVYTTPDAMDWLNLLLQLLGIILVPGYTYIIGLRLERALSARLQAEQDSVGLLDASPIPAFTFEAGNDGGLKMRYANPAMARMLGRPQAELRDSDITRIAIPEDADALREGCARVLLQVKPDSVHQFDIRRGETGGRTRSIMCQASSLRWRGHLLGLCLMTDVSGSERLHEHMETAQRRDYINSLLAGLAHDFRNVLTNIIGTAEVLRMRCDEPEVHPALDTIIETGEGGAEMIHHLQHLMHGKKPVRQAGRLQDSLLSAINIARLKLPGSISLSCTMDDDLPPVYGYAVQIDQAVLQLIDNAAHAIRGSGSIEVSVEKDPRHTLARPGLPAILISVRDNGCGISESDLPHVFESFWSTRKDGAAGLGLGMVKRIVRWHHGEIDIRSLPGSGTTVSMHLPAAAQAGAVSSGEARTGT